jgi:uncharacterized membrane protein
MNDYKQKIPLVLILLLGAVLLFANLGLYDLWGDEVFSFPKGNSFAEALAHSKVVQVSVHPPLHLLMQYVWIHTFAGLDLALNRFIYAIFGLLNVFLAYLIGKELYNHRTGLIAAFLTATSPYLVMYSRMVRYYPLTAFLVLLVVWLFLRYRRTQRWSDWAWFTLAGVALIYEDYLGIVVLAVLYLFTFLRFKDHRTLIPKLLLSALVIFVLFLPWLPVLTQQLGHGTDPYPELAKQTQQENPRLAQKQVGLRGMIFDTIMKVGYLFYTFSLGETTYPWRWIVSLPVMGAFLALLWGGAFRRRVTGNDSTTLLIFTLSGSLVLLLILSQIHGQFSSRAFQLPSKLMFLLPLFLVLVARGGDNLKSRLPQITLGAVLILGNGYGLTNYFSGRQFMNAKYLTPWRQMQAVIESQSEPQDLILTDEEALLKQLYNSDSPLNSFGLVGAIEESHNRFVRVGPYDLYLVIRYRGDEQITIEGLAVRDSLKQLYPLLDVAYYVPTDPEAAPFWKRFLGKEPNPYLVEVYRFRVELAPGDTIISNYGE